jgi:hypothetical protein
MNPEDIKVGKRYKNTLLLGFTYLGCGEFIGSTLPESAKNKFLIIIKYPIGHKNLYGAKVLYGGENDWYWKTFVPFKH